MNELETILEKPLSFFPHRPKGETPVTLVALAPVTPASTTEEKLAALLADAEAVVVTVEALLAFLTNPFSILGNLAGFIGDVTKLVAQLKATIAAIKALA